MKVQAKGHHSFPHFGSFAPTARPDTELALTQDDHLIRAAEDYADLFSLGARNSAALSSPLEVPESA